MIPDLDEYRAALINKILSASSQQEVKYCIDEAINEMEKAGMDTGQVERFTRKTMFDLGSFDPLGKEAQQWANIKSAKVLLNRVWTSLHTITN